MRIAQTAGILKRWSGIMGIMANFHSTRTKIAMHIAPRVIMDITIGLLQSKYVPPEIGMRRSKIAEELKATP
jgi:hypothetical protein